MQGKRLTSPAALYQTTMHPPHTMDAAPSTLNRHKQFRTQSPVYEMQTLPQKGRKSPTDGRQKIVASPIYYRVDDGVYDEHRSRAPQYNIHAQPPGRSASAGHILLVEDKDEFTCCCGCCHVLKGAVFVGFAEALTSLIALIVIIANYVRLGRNYLDHFVAGVCVSVLFIVLLTLHFCGLQSKTPCLLIPNLIGQLVAMVLFVLTAVMLGVKLSSDDHAPLVIWAGWGPMHGDLAKEAGLSLFTVTALIISSCVLAFFFYIWFFYICMRCYRFLTLKNRRREGLVFYENGTAKSPSLVRH